MDADGKEIFVKALATCASGGRNAAQAEGARLGLLKACDGLSRVEKKALTADLRSRSRPATRLLFVAAVAGLAVQHKARYMDAVRPLGDDDISAAAGAMSGIKEDDTDLFLRCLGKATRDDPQQPAAAGADGTAFKVLMGALSAMGEDGAQKSSFLRTQATVALRRNSHKSLKPKPMEGQVPKAPKEESGGATARF